MTMMLRKLRTIKAKKIARELTESIKNLIDDAISEAARSPEESSMGTYAKEEALREKFEEILLKFMEA